MCDDKEKEKGCKSFEEELDLRLEAIEGRLEVLESDFEEFRNRSYDSRSNFNDYDDD